MSIQREVISFKLHDSNSNSVCRFTTQNHHSYKELLRLVAEKTGCTLSKTLGKDSHYVLRDMNGKEQKLCYFDEDDDSILLLKDRDLSEAIGMVRELRWTRLELFMGSEVPKKKPESYRTRSFKPNWMLLGGVGAVGAMAVVAFTLHKMKSG